MSGQAKKNADVNEDGNVNKLDIDVLSKYIVGTYTSLPVKSTIDYGDVNLDGKIDSQDSILLLKYIVGDIVLNDQAKKNADVNIDGQINKTDANLILDYANDIYKSMPILEYIMYGDTNEDG